MGALTAQVMNNPQILAAMQSKLAGMVGMPSGYYDTLPNVVKRRVKALKNLQIERIKIEGEFFKEVHELEVKYGLRYEPLYKKRTEIVSGSYEPNDDECNYPSESEEEEEEDNEVKDEKLPKAKKEDTEEEKKIKGIPEFWLTIFKNVDIINENIQEHDEPILQHLKDVRVILNKDPPVSAPSFVLKELFLCAVHLFRALNSSLRSKITNSLKIQFSPKSMTLNVMQI